jgi:hypothetical protein
MTNEISVQPNETPVVDQPTPEQQAEMKANQQAQIVKAQQMQKVKASLLNSVQQEYSKFMQAITNLPAHPLLRQQSFFRFDEGMYWMRESIQHAQIELQQVEVAPEPAPSAPVESQVAPLSDAASPPPVENADALSQPEAPVS